MFLLMFDVPLRALAGAHERLREIAAEIVDHFEKRLDAIEGKAMVVCMSREICMDLYDEIVTLRPTWHAEDDDAGFVKVVMTGSAIDGERVVRHARTTARREGLARRFKDPNSGFRLVIVCDMWLTGFDCPPMHTMYLDKPLAGHNLMQAIARVNRVFGEKPGGVVVDFLGVSPTSFVPPCTHTRRQAAKAPPFGRFRPRPCPLCSANTKHCAISSTGSTTSALPGKMQRISYIWWYPALTTYSRKRTAGNDS